MLYPIKNNSYTIELTVHTSCYWVLGLLCVIGFIVFIAGPCFWGRQKRLGYVHSYVVRWYMHCDVLNGTLAEKTETD